jgi:hypothetical protein
MTKLVVIAVLVLTAVAAADAIRPQASETTLAEPVRAGERIRHPVTSSGFAPAGPTIHNRVSFRGTEYLSADRIRRAFPAPLPGEMFVIAHLAAAPDGTLVLAVYGFPAAADPVDAIQVWRDGKLESSFLVRPGTFGGGIGFADEGRLIAALSPGGLVVTLFTRNGRFAGHQSATSW